MTGGHPTPARNPLKEGTLIATNSGRLHKVNVDAVMKKTALPDPRTTTPGVFSPTCAHFCDA
jgi:hypothetical protein